jgi:hypothetical protein
MAMTPPKKTIRSFSGASAVLAVGLIFVGSTAFGADAPAGTPGTPRHWPGLRGEAAAGQGGSRRFPSSWATSDWAWAVDLPGIGHSSPQTIAFERHFHVNGLVWGRQVFADLLEIGFNAKIPQGSRFPMEKRHANGFLVLAFGWFHG